MKKVEDVRMKPSHNGGMILSYSEVSPAKKGEPYHARESNYRDETFGPDEHDKAMNRMHELMGKKPEKAVEKQEKKTSKREGPAKKNDKNMEEKPTSMNVRLPHEEDEDEY